ncbi:4-diphosphocytidyl-2c-methyl-D-erythritol kinase [Babesia caballi]|uniref:4-diphosphocytidyl-2c-methyl-D-erythritol kinase n=1 Tax=Babesia caballi TaxID=5871 RepID=A0AAV4LV16_BABCB|nr:4-diphosphocytidyl-2c-methyl-D-erythritol kinase [Babesia caballi]
MRGLTVCLGVAGFLGAPAAFQARHRNVINDERGVRSLIGGADVSPDASDGFWDHEGTAFSKVNLMLQIDPASDVTQPLLRLVSVMQKVRWGDHISIRRLTSHEAATLAGHYETTSEGDVLLMEDDTHRDETFQTPVNFPFDDSNIIARALKAVPRRGERYVVLTRKRVVPGSGLGGGSADGAFVLRALRGPTGPKETLSMGSDVPFLAGSDDVALVTGKGDEITPLPELDYDGHVHILIPDVHASTADAFRKARELLPTGVLTNDTSQIAEVTRSAMAFSGFRPFNALERCVGNEELVLLMKALGAAVPSRRFAMSGSGGACFVLEATDSEMADVRQLYRRPLLMVKTRFKRAADRDAEFIYI